MKKAIIIFTFVIGFFLTIAAGAAFAQQGVPVGPGDNGNNAPIGGIAVVAALGGGYALKKIRDNKKD